MIVIDKPTLKFLLAGRTIKATGKRSSGYRKDRLYSVGISHHRAVCRVQIITAAGNEDGSWSLEVKHATEDKPRLLARNPAGQRTDYVSERAASALDEPEAIDKTTQRKFSAAASSRDEQLRRQQAHARRLQRQGRNLSAVQVQSGALVGLPPDSHIEAAVLGSLDSPVLKSENAA